MAIVGVDSEHYFYKLECGNCGSTDMHIIPNSLVVECKECRHRFAAMELQDIHEKKLRWRGCQGTGDIQSKGQT